MIYIKALVFIILTSALLAYLGTWSKMGDQTLRIFLLIAPAYTFFGLGYMAYTRKKKINDGKSYLYAGMQTGGVSGLLIALIMNIANGSTAPGELLSLIVVGTLFGGALAYPLWAFVENRDREPKIYAFIFLLALAYIMDCLNSISVLED